MIGFTIDCLLYEIRETVPDCNLQQFIEALMYSKNNLLTKGQERCT